MFTEYKKSYSQPSGWDVDLDAFCEEIRTKEGLDDYSSQDIYVILEELITNYFKYAVRPYYTTQIDIKLLIYNSAVEITLEYEGDEFNPFAYAIEMDSDNVTEARVGGKGLHMVRQLAQNYYYQRRESKIILSLIKYRAMESEMNIYEVESGDVTVLELEGRLDIMSSDNLQKTLNEVIDEKMRRKILIDCEKLSFISSAGLRLFMIALKKLTKLQGKIAFCSFNLNNRKIFEITGYDKFFTIYDSRDEALAAF